MAHPTMTAEEVKDVARRGGIVQWFPSKKIERLRIGEVNRDRTKRVLARHLWTGKEHVLPLRKEYCCVELKRTQSIQLGDLLR